MKVYDWVAIFEEYKDLNASEIARKIGSSANVVICASKRFGVVLKKGKKAGKERYNWSEIFNNCSYMSVSEISRKYKISINVVYRAIDRYKVKLKSFKGRPTSVRYNWEDIFKQNNGKNINQISLECGAYPSTVRDAKKRFSNSTISKGVCRG